jgi:DNA-directed RNA polymerase subunit N (RpoN/RPB10)
MSGFGIQQTKGTPIQIPDLSRIKLIEISKTHLSQEEMNRALAAEYEDDDVIPTPLLMPINTRCYSCGNVIRQTVVEDALLGGRNIVEAGNMAGLVRMCCQRMIQTSVPLVHLRKQLERDGELNEEMIQSTGTRPEPEFFKELYENIKIVDYKGLPGGINYQQMAKLTNEQIDIDTYDPSKREGDTIDTFDVMMDQLNGVHVDED